jgi:hypothetical protein
MTAEPQAADRIALAVMARAPSDASGKTRLMSMLGIEDGDDLRRAILLDTLDVTVHAAVAADRVVLFTPRKSGAEFAQLTGDRFRLIPQRGDGLGERLVCAFADLFAQHYAGVLIIGSDLPTLPLNHLERAASALMAHNDPVVLGPAADGGYYLIGLRRPHPELFDRIPWSTAAVLTTTVDGAKGLGLMVSIVPEWYDVDSIDDLQRAVESSASGAHPARRTTQLMARLTAIRRPPTSRVRSSLP